MKSIQYDRFGGPEELRLEDVKLPEPGQDQVLIQVMAASVNPMDWKIRRGEMKMISRSQFPRRLGHDFAGVIEAVGPGVERLKAGDEVFGIATIPQAGAFADYVVADEKNIVPKPPNVSFEQMAAVTIVGLTAWIALVEKAQLKAGQTVFVSGCLGGVGRLAVQIARRRGANVVGSCSPSAGEEALALGVGEVVDYRTFNAALHRRRFDVVFDTAGALSLRQCATMMNQGGTSLHIVPTFAKMIGCLFSFRHKLVFGNPTPQRLASIADAARDGILVSAIGDVVPLSEAISAIVKLEKTGYPKGKLVIVPNRLG